MEDDDVISLSPICSDVETDVETEESSVFNPSAVFTSTPSQASSSSSCPSDTSSVLSRLRSPTVSELARKRKIDRNPPPCGKRRSRGRKGINDPKSVSPQQRVNEFKGEQLIVSNKKLFCSACREELSVKCSVVRMHIQSTKHKAGKERLLNKDILEKDIASALQTRDETTKTKGNALPENQQIYRVKVVKTFLRSGVPLNKINDFRELLEENSLRLTDRRHMSDLVPFILEQEKMKIKEEIQLKPLAVIFDGTSRLGEALCLVIRFIDSEWMIQERLIRLQLLSKSLSGEEIARQLISVLSTELGISSELLVGAMRDCVSSNNVAMRTLKVIYPFIMDVGCFAHTLDRVGERFKTPMAQEFTTYWVSLFSHSFKARLIWKERTGKPVCLFSPTRWWSRWEVMNQLLELFGDIHAFLNSTEEFCAATRKKLLVILNDPHKCVVLKLELAAIIDAGKPFVEGTYKLEGKGVLALECYEIISSITASVDLAHYPNVQAVLSSISISDVSAQQQLKTYVDSCIQPALDYYREHLEADLMAVPLKAFKAARLFSPHKLQELKPDNAALDALQVFPFVSASELTLLKDEYPKYKAASEGLDSAYNPLLFWKNHQSTLPKWSSLAKKVLIIQPSSASAERVFSILNNSFNSRQMCTLEDYLEASLMLQFNKH